MKLASLIAVAGIAAAASAQTMTYSWTVSDAELSPGESATLTLWATMAPGKIGFAGSIYDIIGGDYSEPAVRAIAWEGRFCVVGFTAGIPRLPLNLTLLKSCDVCGVFWGAFAARDPKAPTGPPA